VIPNLYSCKTNVEFTIVCFDGIDVIGRLCTEVGGWILTLDFRYKKLKMLPFMVTNHKRWERWNFSTMKSECVEMAHFKKYRSFKCLVQVNCVSPFIIIILIMSKNWKVRYSRSESELFALDSKYVRYKQGNTVYFIKFH